MRSLLSLLREWSCGQARTATPGRSTTERRPFVTPVGGAAPLVPPRIRRSATALAVAGALVLVALAARYRDTDAAGRLDEAAMSVIQDLLANHAQELWLIVRLGDPVPIFAMAVLLALICLAIRRRRLAVLAFAGPGATGIFTTVLQPLVGRTLEGDFSLPSGHTGVATAISTVAAQSLSDFRQHILVSEYCCARVGIRHFVNRLSLYCNLSGGAHFKPLVLNIHMPQVKCRVAQLE